MDIAKEKNPLLSIVIPVRNGGKTLDTCLRSIRKSWYKNYEVIIVDDHSTDDTVSIAERHNCKVISAVNGYGANYARNLGAKNAKGEILVFLDSDIMIGRDSLLNIVETLEDDFIDAVVGIYTAKHRHETFISQYKNLWVRYSYLKSPPLIDWLFGAISGIKRDTFYKLGGFNDELLARHGHDDIELGKRLARANLKIVLNLDIEVEHLKNYTFKSFVKNEFYRSIGFAELATNLGEITRSIGKGFVNVYPSFVISTVLSFLIFILFIGVLFNIWSYWYLLGAGIIYFLLNIRFLNYLEQVRGLFAMIAMIPILFVDHLVCFVGSLFGVIKGLAKKN